MDKFSQEYKKLNSSQQEAVDAIEGPVTVIAGPGTGKTKILTLRIANILKKTDITADNILALTFTESGAYSMRRNLVEIMGSLAYRVTITTFHGFCNSVISDNPEEFPHIIGRTNVTPVDRIRIIEGIIRAGQFDYLKPFGNIYHYVYPALSKISELKKDNISPKHFQKLINVRKKEFNKQQDLYYKKGRLIGKMRGIYAKEKKDIEKGRELAEIYIAYQKELRDKSVYDYDDMIVEVIRALESQENLQLSLQEQFQYILADEHQDANLAQNRLLELLSSYHYPFPNLFIVGDEKQAIFRFQGASHENFLYFKRLYPKTHMIHLTDNYRSSQMILDAAGSVITKNPNFKVDVKSELVAKTGKAGKKIKIVQLIDSPSEHAFIAGDIYKKILDGVSPKEIAIFFRNNKDATMMIHALERKSIRYILKSDESVLMDHDIKKFITLLEYVSDYGNEEKLLAVLHIDFLGMLPLDVYKISRFAKDKHISLHDVLGNESSLSSANIKLIDKCVYLAKKLEEWAKASKNDPPLTLLERMIEESGFLAYILQLPYAEDKNAKLVGLFDELMSAVESHREYKLGDFLTYLRILSEYRVSIGMRRTYTHRSGVHLMTAHRAKGLEFSHVYIIGVSDGHWGGRKQISHFSNFPAWTKVETDKADDERRLFYVALTRAKEDVTITYCLTDTSGRERLPSQFISEIDENFVSRLNHKEINLVTRYSSTPSIKTKKRGKNQEEVEYVAELFAEEGLSVTALNNYLTCPWKYVYLNLLRVPRAMTKHQLYGIAVHNTLRDFFEKYKCGDEYGRDILLTKFKEYLVRVPLGDQDFKETLTKGERALSGYYRTYQGSWNRHIVNEYAISGVIIDGVKLRGRLDKIEYLDDARAVNVVDYKTGRPKSRNDIEGKTKNSAGDYKRQLIFYKLLLDRGSGGKLIMKTGEIDFVEPDRNGKYRKEKFEINSSETQELTSVIRRVADEICNLTFSDNYCDDSKCEFCKLKKMTT